MAARMPGMAAPNSTDCKPASLYRTMALDSLQCVLRAGRIKAAIAAEHWADTKLINPNQEKKTPGWPLFHINSALICRHVVPCGVSAMAIPADSSLVRIASARLKSRALRA